MKSTLLPPVSIILDSFSLNVPELNLIKGEKIAIVGANGAGKSTYLKSLIDQIDCCYLSQNPFIIEVLSVYLNVYAGGLEKFSLFENLKNLVIHNQGQKKIIKDILSNFSMEEKLDQVTGSLSGGEKMKLTLARALFSEQKTILVDEPLSAVAEKDQEAILNLIFSKFETSITVIHHHEHLPKFDKVMILDKGKLAFFGASDSSEVKKWPG